MTAAGLATVEDGDVAHAQAAASQAREAALRKALDKFFNAWMNGCILREHTEAIWTALALPSDRTALDALLAEARAKALREAADRVPEQELRLETAAWLRNLADEAEAKR